MSDAQGFVPLAGALAPLGLVVAWLLAQRVPVERLVPLAAPVLVLAAAGFGFSTLLAPTAFWVPWVGLAGSGIASAWLGAILLLLLFRVFGPAKHYLSIAAFAGLASELARQPMLSLVYGVRMGHPDVPVLSVIFLAFVVALWSLVGGHMVARKLTNQEPPIREPDDVRPAT